jgi:phosphatidylserine decarboxylase
MQTKIAAPNVGGIATIADAKAMGSRLAHGQTPEKTREVKMWKVGKAGRNVVFTSSISL